MTSHIRVAAIATINLFFACLSSRAQVPQIINYQGRVTVGAVNFEGSGQFKFALVNSSGTITYWSNDGTTSAGSEPSNSVSRPVVRGVYSVLLGDTTLANMTAIPTGVFANGDVRLRIWFNDGNAGFQLLSPDQRIASVGYAMAADNGAPPGAVMAYAGINAPPSRWLLCDGSAVSRTQYADLFAAVGTVYGAGDGSTTFNLPDLRGRLPVGKDSLVNGTLANRVTTAGSGINGNALGSTGGAEQRATSVSVSQQPTFTVNSHQHPLSNAGYAKISISAVSGQAVTMQRITIATPYSITHTADTTGYGGSGSENGAAGLGGTTDAATAGTTRTADVALSNPAIPAMPPTVILNYIIKY